MKWFSLVIVIFFSCVLNISSENIDWMPDPALREAVREALELPDRVPLTKDHMQDLDILIAEGRGISDLTGLEFAINLREANLGDNSITDLRPLANLAHLAELGLPENTISDISPLAGLQNLVFLIISHNPISDLSPLTGLPKFRELQARRIWTTDFSSLEGLGLEIHRDEICEIAPFPSPVRERIQNRTFPSLTFDFHSLIYNTEPVRWLNEWDDPDNYHDVATQHDMHYYTHRFGLVWALTPTAPTQGLSTQLAGNIEEVLERYKKYDKNPNMLFIPAIVVHGYSLDDDDILSDSDLWLRDADGQLIKREGLPADYKPEGVLAILNPKVQQLVIDRAVAVADCGFFDGVLFDSWDGYHQYYYGKYFNIDGEVVIQAYINILKGIRERVRDDFLILVNRNFGKSPRYAEWINGSFMETHRDRQDGYSYEKLRGIEEALSWNEEYLREPRINVLLGQGVDQPIDSPDNLRWMRVITTLSLTHSDGYSVFVTPDPGGIMWYDFYDADLGRPVGEKAQTYDNRYGIFIREFDNGWAVYNRSGREQIIALPRSEGVANGVVGTEHVLADLDGEIYLKSEAEVETPPTVDVNGDGIVNILDLVVVANAFGETDPDINGDGTVNILDLVIVANAFE
ncbi:MAG: putative glycoside hydrolase [Candidatus Poribacteria bacterium]|nr:putative glycoside hydrolase [Candidatus Poribacteria bacterium]